MRQIIRVPRDSEAPLMRFSCSIARLMPGCNLLNCCYFVPIWHRLSIHEEEKSTRPVDYSLVAPRRNRAICVAKPLWSSFPGKGNPSGILIDVE